MHGEVERPEGVFLFFLSPFSPLPHLLPHCVLHCFSFPFIPLLYSSLPFFIFFFLCFLFLISVSFLLPFRRYLIPLLPLLLFPLRFFCINSSFTSVVLSYTLSLSRSFCFPSFTNSSFFSYSFLFPVYLS